MPPPSPLGILYRFVPPGHSWTGSYSVAENYHYYYTDLEWTSSSEVTDTYDFTSTMTYNHEAGMHGDQVGLVDEAANYKRVAVPVGSLVNRVKCTFSLDTLPYNQVHPEYTAKTDILAIWQQDSVDTEPPMSWDWLFYLAVLNDGKLMLNDNYLGASTNAISAGTSYDLELYFHRNNASDDSPTIQVWIDNSLWLTDLYGGYNWSLAYLQLTAGFMPYSPGNYALPHETTSVVLHMEDIIWTIEGSQAHWTMMAP